jgi:hypothetical protein
MQFAVGVLARFVQKPAQAHWEALKRLIWYAYTTRDLWLTLGGEDILLHGNVDADWASQPDRHSVSGFVYSCSAV